MGARDAAGADVGDDVVFEVGNDEGAPWGLAEPQNAMPDPEVAGTRWSPSGRRVTWATRAAVTLVLLAVAVLLWRDHQQSVLERDPSYRFGRTVMDYVEGIPNAGATPEDACDRALASRPVPVAHYIKAKARSGCLDEWTALNR